MFELTFFINFCCFVASIFIPDRIRLCIRQKSRLDAEKSRIPLPDGCLPPTSLQSWREYSPSQKIPAITAPGCVYYTRGKLCEKVS